MGERAANETLDDYLSKIELLNSLQIIRTLKDSQYERTSLASRPSGKRYILKELKDVSDKTHPYETLENHSCKFLPKVYVALRIDNKLHVVMEALEGPTLSDKIISSGTMSPEEALECLTGVIRGVDYLHSSFDKPLIHRDIKPDRQHHPHKRRRSPYRLWDHAVMGRAR